MLPLLIHWERAMQIQRVAGYAALAQRLRERMRKRGVDRNGVPLWTKAEDDAIRRFYPDYKALRRMLTRRTADAIKTRALFLDVTKPRFRWTAAQASRLRRIYP